MQIGCGISPTRPHGVAVPAFTPASISGLQLWLDASDASTLFTDSAGTTPATADGDPVGRWADKSGNAKNGTQTDGTKKPLFKLNLQNGLPAIRFDSANDMLSLASITQQLPFDLLVVARMQSTTIANTCLMDRTTGSSPYPPAVYLGVGYPRTPGLYWGTADYRVSVSITQATHMIRYRVTSAKVNLTIDNGSELVINHSNSVLSSWSSIGTSAQAMQADVCEMMMYHSTVSSGDYASLTSYLNAKWSIY